MAYRGAVREPVVCSGGSECEGVSDVDRARPVRRGRSVTPRLASLWDENHRLYMDNLRLWDCLTLVRGDPSMTCQNAIKLIFGLNDDEYFRMFPGGNIYHVSNDQAKTENARLKDENARLHAAVWVLRDNPSLQADSTVAAIFRLNESQFLSKFHRDASNYSLGQASAPPPKPQYQNNNKEDRKSLRTSLDLGHEPTMAIHLTNKPLKGSCFAVDKLGSSKGSRKQRSQSLAPPKRRHNDGSSCIQHYDFTSNWKPTTAPEDESISSEKGSSMESHLNSDWAVLCWRQNHMFRPVDLHALEGVDANGDCEHGKHRSQVTEAQSKSMKCREFRRSNSVSRGGNILAERINKGPSHAVPIKCVSFAEPPPSCQIGSPTATEFLCCGDRVKVILDAKYSHNHCTHSQNEIDLPTYTVDVEGLLKNNENSTKCGRKPQRTSDVYSTATIREPSKKYQRDTATSPVLDTRTCFLILGQPSKNRRQEQGDASKDSCVVTSSDNFLLDNNNNSGTYLPDNKNSETYLSDNNNNSDTYLPNNNSDTYLPDNNNSDTYLPNNNSDTYLPDNNTSGNYLPDNNNSDTYLPNNNNRDTYLPNNNTSGTYIPDNINSDTYLPNNNNRDTHLPNNNNSDSYLPDNNKNTDTYLSDNNNSDTYLPDNNKNSDTYLPTNSSDSDTATVLKA